MLRSSGKRTWRSQCCEAAESELGEANAAKQRKAAVDKICGYMNKRLNFNN
jgi:hypothetical protein